MTETAEKPGKPAAKPSSPPWLKMTLEIGPLILFFFANARPKLFAPYAHLVLPPHLLIGENAGLFTATAVLIPAVLIALVVSFIQKRRLPVMPLVTAILVIIFGALTIYFQDPRFIKMKPTILYLVFGGALLGGLYLKKPILEIVLDNAMPLTEQGWRILTLRWGLFFLALAILNEIVWRTQSNNVWVAFKFPGTVILIFLFTLAQVPLMLKHELKEEEPTA
ncbi:MAG: septation protein A [Methylovirgula sp.]